MLLPRLRRPGLDTLWEIQEQLTPLFETLLEDIWYHGECGECSDDIPFLLTQPLVPTAI